MTKQSEYKMLKADRNSYASIRGNSHCYDFSSKNNVEGQRMNQEINESMNQWINKDESLNESMSGSMIESKKESINQWIDKRIYELINHSVNQSINHSFNHSIKPGITSDILEFVVKEDKSIIACHKIDVHKKADMEEEVTRTGHNETPSVGRFGRDTVLLEYRHNGVPYTHPT